MINRCKGTIIKRFIILISITVLIGSLAAFVIFRTPILNSEPYISSIIVPHHDLVAKQRSATFEKIAHRTNDRPIILLSPNHYGVGSAAIQTRSGEFSTNNGSIVISSALLDVAIDNGARDSQLTFETEHGIKALLPDIADYYPNIEILPLIISEEASLESLQKLLDALHNSCTDCLLITSADFSHYNPYLLSEMHDKLTIRGLTSLDGKLLDTRAEIEPMHLPTITTYWAQLNNTEKFVLDQHTNSTHLENNYYAEGTTHIMGWYETGDKEMAVPSVSITITGDIQMRNATKEFEDRLSKLGPRVLWGSDAVVASSKNLDSVSDSVLSRNLRWLHTSHLLKRGESGNSTFVASDASLIAEQQPAIINGEGQKIVLFHFEENSAPIDLSPYENENVVIYAQWGATKPVQQRELARTWVDQGADVVLGMGNLALGTSEIYEDRPIIYNIGAMLSEATENKSLTIVANFTETTIELLPLFIAQENGYPILQRSHAADKELSILLPDFMRYLHSDKGGLLFSIDK